MKHITFEKTTVSKEIEKGNIERQIRKYVREIVENKSIARCLLAVPTTPHLSMPFKNAPVYIRRNKNEKIMMTLKTRNQKQNWVPQKSFIPVI